MTFLITGAGRGLGLEYTRQLLAKKQNVIAWLRDPEKAKELKELQKQYTSQLTVQKVDITQQESISSAVAKITGGVDVLINNAGVLLDQGEKFISLPMETVEETFAVNVLAPMMVTQTLLPLLQKSATPLVVNMSSLMGSLTDNTSGGYYAYRMSKTALNMFSKSFGLDHPKIKILALHPGWAHTDMGGSNAPVSPQDSVAGLLSVIFESQKYPTTSFIDYKGKLLPW
jgi:NAD(P)-dependent dehydrogenase (short-subunit alcohol dehydrogenase family)